jgi:hypothetical protein
MNVLIHANHYAVCSGRYYADAFKRAGHSVRAMGRAMGREIWGMSLPRELAWQPEPPEDGWQPNLIVYADSDPRVLDVVIEGAPRVVIGVDNHVREYRRPHFEHYFLAHRNASLEKWEITPEKPHDVRDALVSLAQDMTHLPCAYDPTIHTPSPIPFAEREYDVVLLGFPYPQRVRAVSELRAAGFKVFAGLGFVGESYAAAHHNARISLCLSVAGDAAQRVFESAAMGCVVLTDNCKDFSILQPNGFYLLEEGQSIVKACEEILNDPRIAEEQIAQSQAWALDHTWDARVKVVTDWFEANEERARAWAT